MDDFNQEDRKHRVQVFPVSVKFTFMSYGFKVFLAHHKAFVGIGQSGMSKSLAQFIDTLSRIKERPAKLSRLLSISRYTMGYFFCCYCSCKKITSFM